MFLEIGFGKQLAKCLKSACRNGPLLVILKPGSVQLYYKRILYSKNSDKIFSFLTIKITILQSILHG